MAARNKKKNDLDSLIDLTKSTQTLISQFLAALTADANAPLPPNPPNPLHVLRDSAALLKAQTTKLSLLLLNKPFTPTAIASIIRQIAGTCLPAMMGAVEICVPEIWGRLPRKEVQARVRTVLREMDVCMAEVLDVARQSQADTSGAKATLASAGGEKTRQTGRDTLASTGVVWAACDAVSALENLGIGGIAVKKAEQYRDMINDAIEELREWSEEGDDENDEDGGLDSGDDAGDSDGHDSVEDMFAAANSLPKDREDLRELLDETLGKLKKISMLYTALIKRRLKTFDSNIAGKRVNVDTLDSVMEKLRRLPHQVDELASAFYDLDDEATKQRLSSCITEAREAMTLVKSDWNSVDDSFSAWASKWSELIE